MRGSVCVVGQKVTARGEQQKIKLETEGKVKFEKSSSLSIWIKPVRLQEASGEAGS